MSAIKFTAATAAFGIYLLLMTLAFDAWVWEQDGHCGDAVVIHHLRDCR